MSFLFDLKTFTLTWCLKKWDWKKLTDIYYYEIVWENIWNRRIQVSNLGQGRIATTAPFAILSFGCGGKAIGQRTHGSINNSPHPTLCPSIGRWSRARPRSHRRCQIVQKKYFFSDLVLRAGLNAHRWALTPARTRSFATIVNTNLRFASISRLGNVIRNILIVANSARQSPVLLGDLGAKNNTFSGKQTSVCFVFWSAF